MKLSVDHPPRVELKWRLAWEEVEEPRVEGPREIRVLVEMREEAAVEMRPASGHANLGVIEARTGQGIQRERGPECHQDRGEHGDLHAQRCEREQEEERVAETDLRQRVFERPVRLRTFERAQKDAE